MDMGEHNRAIPGPLHNRCIYVQIHGNKLKHK